MEPEHKDYVVTALPQHIMAAIDLEANFKLYSYRVIAPEVFMERSLQIMMDALGKIDEIAKKNQEKMVTSETE